MILLTSVLSALIATLTTVVVQRRGARYWEVQERWRFKADYYGRLLQNLAEQPGRAV